MKVSDIRLEMELYGVDEADIAEIVALHESKGLGHEMLDHELTKRGYPGLFTVDYDAYDEWEEDDFQYNEKFPHKQSYRD